MWNPITAAEIIAADKPNAQKKWIACERKRIAYEIKVINRIDAWKKKKAIRGVILKVHAFEGDMDKRQKRAHQQFLQRVVDQLSKEGFWCTPSVRPYDPTILELTIELWPYSKKTRQRAR